MSGPRVAVVGHVEWLDFAVVDHLPRAGEIVTAREHVAVAAGGGAVAAIQLLRLAGAADFFTVVGDDLLGERSAAELRERGLTLHAVTRQVPQRRAFTHVDGNAERTITVLGDRLVPHADDPLPWDLLAQVDGVYFTGADGAAARAARRARALVATGRAPEALIAGGVVPDVLVASERDEKEVAGVEAFEAALGANSPAPGGGPSGPRYTIFTRGGEGGHWHGTDGSSGTWEAVRPPSAPVDAYGCGDSFAAALAYGLGAGLGIERTIALAARCGAWCVTGRGPYGHQLTRAELADDELGLSARPRR
ncbi:PfkB family carbohydrate kinase [Conexibacter sp. CPCC 206217]|uniref:PfkB family carbohydrate kinase n=1 Tax=Conexibacter sp. CPCC 206217 TaxID=3064574 RepID=UPI002718A542|nr:PfkB family carbohydrate kinase [Conexibacter sp. CPCC 206217]MDO8211884.1 PfkB family carbohydrate kinase [Conexibacter sp. CPCC 206217]